jgi:adenylate cyclase
VGDEVIAAWPIDDGAAAGAVRACFSAMETLESRAGLYTDQFGQHAHFRAGLHAGPVVLGELGYSRMEIAFLGDTMNTTARIHELCRETGNRVIASDALLAHVEALPAGIEKSPLGPIALRGKERALELFALAAAASAV